MHRPFCGVYPAEACDNVVASTFGIVCNSRTSENPAQWPRRFARLRNFARAAPQKQ